MDLHPTVQEASEHVRRVYDFGVTYFDCAASYWDGRAEEAYGIGLTDIRKKVFLTTKSGKRTKADAEAELANSLKKLKTDHLDLWQMHGVQKGRDRSDPRAGRRHGGIRNRKKKAGKCRFIGFTGHYDPAVHAQLLKAYDKWDTVLMPVHAADHAYLSFEKAALPLAVEMGIGIQAIKGASEPLPARESIQDPPWSTGRKSSKTPHVISE